MISMGYESASHKAHEAKSKPNGMSGKRLSSGVYPIRNLYLAQIEWYGSSPSKSNPASSMTDMLLHNAQHALHSIRTAAPYRENLGRLGIPKGRRGTRCLTMLGSGYTGF